VKIAVIAAGAIRHRRPRCAEIDQRWIVVGIEDDIGRLDVTMEEARLVHGIESVEQSFEQTFGVGRRQLAIALETLVEGVAARQPHDHVGRSVGLEKVVDADDGWRPLEGRQNPGFLEKAITSPDEVFRKLRRAGHDHRVHREGRGSSAGTP